jgi:hypothetical protein
MWWMALGLCMVFVISGVAITIRVMTKICVYRGDDKKWWLNRTYRVQAMRLLVIVFLAEIAVMELSVLAAFILLCAGLALAVIVYWVWPALAILFWIVFMIRATQYAGSLHSSTQDPGE